MFAVPWSLFEREAIRGFTSHRERASDVGLSRSGHQNAMAPVSAHRARGGIRSQPTGTRHGSYPRACSRAMGARSAGAPHRALRGRAGTQSEYRSAHACSCLSARSWSDGPLVVVRARSMAHHPTSRTSSASGSSANASNVSSIALGSAGTDGARALRRRCDTHANLAVLSLALEAHTLPYTTAAGRGRCAALCSSASRARAVGEPSVLHGLERSPGCPSSGRARGATRTSTKVTGVRALGSRLGDAGPPTSSARAALSRATPWRSCSRVSSPVRGGSPCGRRARARRSEASHRPPAFEIVRRLNRELREHAPRTFTTLDFFCLSAASAFGVVRPAPTPRTRS